MWNLRFFARQVSYISYMRIIYYKDLKLQTSVFKRTMVVFEHLNKSNVNNCYMKYS